MENSVMFQQSRIDGFGASLIDSSLGSIIPRGNSEGNAHGSKEDRYSTNLNVNDTNNIIHMQNIVPLGNFESLRKSFKTNKSKMSDIHFRPAEIESAQYSERNTLKNLHFDE